MTITLTKHTSILAFAILFSLFPISLFCQNSQSSKPHIYCPLDCFNELILETNTGKITCIEDTIILSATTNITNTSFWWITPNNTRLIGASIETSEIGIHEVFVKNNSSGRIFSKSVQVTDGKIYPNVTTLGGVIDCNHTETTLHTAASTQNIQFLWSGPNGFSETFASPTVKEGGMYILTSTELQSGCKSIDTALVTVNQTKPIAKCSVSEELNCYTKSVWLSSLGSSVGQNFQYMWWSSDGFSTEPYDSTFAKVTAADIYTLKVLNTENGCSASSNVLVLENKNFINTLLLEILPPFTYKEDEILVSLVDIFNENNQNYLAVSAKNRVRKISKFEIYDPWGQLLFKANDFDPNSLPLGCDDKFLQKQMQPKAYTWAAQIELLNGKTLELHGDVGISR
jgi:hypothetical protein